MFLFAMFKFNRENINQQEQQIDFKCYCKSDKYYGKRCEKKINQCQNETCSGNGVCKILNENELNETIKCDCFGLNDFEGSKCETKTFKMTFIQTTIKSTAYIAILFLVSLGLLVVLIDLHSIFMLKNSPSSSFNQHLKSKSNKLIKTNIKSQPEPKKLVYIP